MVKTQHSPTCRMAFGRKDASCPRCQELIKGSPARKAWGHMTRANEQRQILAIWNHDCKASGCNPFCCTFGDN